LLIYAQNVTIVTHFIVIKEFMMFKLDKFTIIINQFEEEKLIYFCYYNNYIIVRTYYNIHYVLN